MYQMTSGKSIEKKLFIFIFIIQIFLISLNAFDAIFLNFIEETVYTFTRSQTRSVKLS